MSAGLLRPAGVLAACALAALFAGAYLVAAAAVSAPSAASPRLGLRGHRRQVQLARSPAWALVEPLVRWLALRLAFVLDEAQRASLERRLVLGGDWLGITADELVALSFLSGAVGLFAGTVVTQISHIGAPVVIGGLFVGAQLPTSRLADATRIRVKQIDRGLPHAIDLLVLGMSAGLDFPGSVRQVVEKYGTHDNPIVDELTLMLQGMALGHTRARVLQQFAERVGSIPVRELVSAVVQAESHGNPLAPTLKIQAEVSRQRRTVRAEEAAAKAGVAMVGPLCLLFISILLLIVAPLALGLKDAMNAAPR